MRVIQNEFREFELALRSRSRNHLISKRVENGGGKRGECSKGLKPELGLN